jgi:hypothetical protein
MDLRGEDCTHSEIRAPCLNCRGSAEGDGAGNFVPYDAAIGNHALARAPRLCYECGETFWLRLVIQSAPSYSILS